MLQTFTTKLAKRANLTHDVFVFTFSLEEPKELIFTPGQYMVLMVPQPGEEDFPRRKLYSISSSANIKNSFELLVKIVPGGVGSEYLMSLTEGDMATFQGPAGVFAMRGTPAQKVFIATGTGIAPTHSILTTYLNSQNVILNEVKDPDRRSKDVSLDSSLIAQNDDNTKQVRNDRSKFKLLWGLRKRHDMYFLEELQQLKNANPNFSFEIYLSREEKDDPQQNIFAGRVNKGIEKLIQASSIQFPTSEFYLSGDRDIIESLRQLILSLGAKTENITVEKFV